MERIKLAKLSLSDIEKLGLHHCRSSYYIDEEEFVPFVRVSILPCGVKAREIPPYEEIWLEYSPKWKEYYAVEYFKGREVGMTKVDIEKVMDLIKEYLARVARIEHYIEEEF